MPGFEVYVGDFAGNTGATAVEMQPGVLSRGYDGSEELTLKAAGRDLAALAYPLRKDRSEVELRQDGTAVARLAVLDVGESGPGQVQVRCGPLSEWFRKLFIDTGSDRVDLLPNSDFSSGLTGWTAHGPGVAASVVYEPDATSQSAVQLVGTATDEPTYLSQFITVAGGGIGELITCRFHFKVLDFQGEAEGSFGLFLRQVDGSGNVLSVDSAIFTIDGRTPAGDQRAVVQTEVPAGATNADNLEVRLYCLDGTIEWYEGAVNKDESLSRVYFPGLVGPFDQADNAAAIIAFAQDPANGKTDLGITTDPVATGVDRSQVWEYDRHYNALSELERYRAWDDGFDWWFKPGTRVWTNAAGRRGVDRSATVTLSPANAEVVPGSWKWLGDSASQVGALSEFGGPAREEGWATDGTAPRVVQKLVQPNNNPPVATLDALAQRSLALASASEEVRILLTDYDGSLAAVDLGLGDVVALDFDFGFPVLSGNWRMWLWEMDPNADGLVTTTWRPA